MNPETRKTLMVSTSNLPEKLANRMDDGREVGVVYSPVEYGWLIRWWPNRKCLPKAWSMIPIPLKRVIEAAESNGCTMVLFDTDASPIEGLQMWEW